MTISLAFDVSPGFSTTYNLWDSVRFHDYLTRVILMTSAAYGQNLSTSGRPCVKSSQKG